MRKRIMLVDEKKKVELEKAMKQCQEARLGVRLQAVRLAYTGLHTLSEIAQMTGRTRSMVVR